MTPAKKVVQTAREIRQLGKEQVRSLLAFMAEEQTKTVAVRSYEGLSRLIGPVSEEDAKEW